jgi:hypothetical protein
MITVQCRSIPGALPRIEFRHNGVVASNLDTVIIKKYPTLYPFSTFSRRDDLVRKGSVVRRFKGVTKPRSLFSCDTGHPKIIAVLEADIFLEADI